MSTFCVPDELVHHLCSMNALTPQDAERLAIEVMHYFASTTEEFVVQRHQELQKAGHSNAVIYRMIEQETAQRVFSTSPISIRQIRRLIYG